LPNVNPLLLPTLILAIALFFAGRRLSGIGGSARREYALAIAAVVASIPAALFAVYYLHVLDRQAWFFAYRSAQFSELTAAGVGFGIGVAAGLLTRTGLSKSSPFLARFVPGILLLCGIAVIGVPYSKPVIAPLKIQLQDRWVDGVCIQTTPSTCGPSR